MRQDVDPAFADLLADPRNALRRPPAHVSLSQVREAASAMMLVVEPAPIHAVETVSVAGPAGDLNLRLYRPGPATGMPLALYFHGGGFVLGSLDTHDGICCELARRAGAVVASVDYRLAPEAPFPAAIQDGLAALKAVIRQGAAWSLDATRISLCGDSAGANLAVAVALAARADHLRIGHLGLIYPVVDPNCDSPSMAALADGYMLTRESMIWFWELYLGEARTSRPALAALLDADLHGLPPTTVLTAEFDPLCDEGERLAQALREAAVPVVARRYLGMIHGFAGMANLTPVANLAISDLANDLRTALSAGFLL